MQPLSQIFISSTLANYSAVSCSTDLEKAMVEKEKDQLFAKFYLHSNKANESSMNEVVQRWEYQSGSENR